MRRTALLAIGWCLSCGAPELAGSEVLESGREPDFRPCRFFARPVNTTEEHALRLASFKVNVAAGSAATRTHLELDLRNPNPWQAEAVLRIPIPPGAAVTRAVLHVNGHPMEGAVLSRDRATAIYRAITTKRKDPALVAWAGPGWVDVSIFPFAGQETRRFELEWTEPTAWAQGRAWYRMPRLSQRGGPVFLPDLVTVNGSSVGQSTSGWLPLALEAPSLLSISTTAGEPYGYVLARTPAGPVEEPGGVYVLAETSMAMGALDRSRQRAVLEQVFNSKAPGARLSVAAVDWVFQELAVDAQRAQLPDVLRRLDSIPSAGALDLGEVLRRSCARATAVHARTVLFLGRGQHAFAADPFEDPLKCFQDAGIALLAIGTSDPVPADFADAASLTGGGSLAFDAWDETASVVLALQRHPAPSLLEGRVEGWRPLLTVTGEVRWVARYLGQPPAEATVSNGPGLEALWARSVLSGAGTSARSLEPARPVLAPLTSMLVLETEDDYRRFGVPVPEAAPGDAQGFGGLGLGLGRSGAVRGQGSEGSGEATARGITSSEPTVIGALDKELIRMVIRRNRNQIRYCYQSQLVQFPQLVGKVVVKFVINASGLVVSSRVERSTAANAGLEACVVGRVRTWVFPKPAGGGVVIVTYPFVFGIPALFDGPPLGPPAPTPWQIALSLMTTGQSVADRTSAVARLVGAPPKLGPAAVGWWLKLTQLRNADADSRMDALLLSAWLLRSAEPGADARRVLSEIAPVQPARAAATFRRWELGEDASRVERCGADR